MTAITDLQPTLIFIPDISGFTAFINEVEVEHSTHIIAELLEVIIESNNLNLQLSEIEGDAVLFYRMGDEPSLEEIIRQAEVMFMKFHQHLMLYERDRICQCGACSAAHELSLKFVYHFGQVTMRQIKRHKKLFGPDVTLAHRLLKNTINGNEYLLLSSIPKDSRLNAYDWVLMKKGKSDYDAIGEVAYNYFSLTPLRSQVRELPARNKTEPPGKRVSASIMINASLEAVHGVVLNVSLKPKWVSGLKSVQGQGGPLGRIGSKHSCLLSTGNLNVELVAHNVENGVIEYVEKSDSIKWLAPMFTFFTMTKVSSKTTRIEENIHYRKTLLSMLYLDFPLRLFMFVIAKRSLANLKSYVERLPNQTDFVTS